MGMTYQDAGVSIDRGDEFVDWIKGLEPHGPEALRSRVVAGVGGFASLFRGDFKQMKSPCLVSATDGVGTKLKLAVELNDVSTIGQDLVAMCVNDLLCVGAQPLFFLDYYAVAQLNLDQAKSFLLGVRKACDEAECLLIGGETAEMPGVYQGADFDCAGFAVGVVDEERALGAHKVRPGDRLIGIESSGFHSNGYSLLRKLFAGHPAEFKKNKLLTPTHLYSKFVRELLGTASPHAFCHITGGGIENLLRIVPQGLSVHINDWPIEGIFLEAMRLAEISEVEVRRTFNCGVGFVAVVAQEDFDKTIHCASELGLKTLNLGYIIETPGSKEVIIGE